MQKKALFTYSPNTYSQSVVATLCQPPFGMLIKERSYTSDSYRFGFNGKEKDDEVSGEGNVIAYELRIYDARMGRYLSVDPRTKEYTWQSTYAYYANSPIWKIDFMGGGDNQEDEKSSNPEPTNKFQEGWWNLRLALKKVTTRRDELDKVSIWVKAKDPITGAKSRSKYCGKYCNVDGIKGNGGGIGGSVTVPGSPTTTSVPPGGAVPAGGPPVGGGTLLAFQSENNYPGATPRLLTGAAVPLQTNFVIPPPPAGFTGTTGTLWITYSTNLAVAGTPTGTDNISNSIAIIPMAGGVPSGPAILNTNQFLNLPAAPPNNAGPFRVNVGQQFQLNSTANVAAVAAGATGDRFYVMVRVTFP